MNEQLRTIAQGETLTQDAAADAMHTMLRGEAEPVQLAAFLLGLRSRGETVDELVAFTRVMREYAVPVRCDDPHAIDLCGTGGDSSDTFNISTTAAFVCAGAGVTVAKHGNRSVSSTCGSADVLEALGVNIEMRQAGVEHCLDKAGIAFIFAPYFHPAMRFVMPVRRQLGVRTFFNVLGPLCNPAGVRRQLVGAFSEDVAARMASILAHLGAAHVVTAHADDGLDELSLSAPTTIFEYNAEDSDLTLDTLHPYRVEPEQHGLGRCAQDQLKGETLKDNVTILRNVLDGHPGPTRDVVVLNAAYALHTSGTFASLDACLQAAQASIDDGKARAALDRLISVSTTRLFAA